MSRAAATAAARTRRVSVPAAPRRVSGPARPNTRGATIPLPPRVVPRGRRIPAANPVAGAVGRFVELGSLSLSSRWMDRLVRGQAWVVIIGIALIGIVAMRVSLLQLNTGISRAVETKATLERTNASLRVQNSRLGTAERIQAVASKRGLIMPSPGNIRYLSARDRAGDASRAARAMRAPDPRSAETAAAATATAGAAADPAAPTAEAPAAAPAPEPVTPEPAPTPEPVTPAAAPLPEQTQTQTETPPAPVEEPAAAPTATPTGAVAAP